MRISIYTFIKDGIYFDYHIVQMLKHHIELADEIIVNEGYSSDDTYNQIKDLSPKIHIFRSHWVPSKQTNIYTQFKETARKKCTGDWCILLDADEFIPEWEFENLRKYLAETDKIIVPMKYINFYGNYKIYNENPRKFSWPEFKFTIHRNKEDIEVWGDGSNVKIKNAQPESFQSGRCFECHHFGFVRDPARLRHKWHIQHRLNNSNNPKWHKMPGFLFDLIPHNWLDEDFLGDLAVYDGPFIKAVREEPSEFVRDNFVLYDNLSKHT